jgi:SAM-dependent methyltransferase
MNFNEYASFYDTLYASKDYQAECDYLEVLLRRFTFTPVHSLLDLGCGTGGHALPLAARGYRLTGVDRSPQMLAAARAKPGASAVEFLEGDLRHLDIGRTFDAVLALFAVTCYQTTNDDLLLAFRAVRRHLAPGGLFLFDGWYGPAVLAERPAERVKTIESGAERIIRLARPTLDEAAQTVQVDYTVLRLRERQVLAEVHESHRMRFLFTQEIDLLCRLAGFQLVHSCVFLEPERPPTARDWNVTWVTRAV